MATRWPGWVYDDGDEPDPRFSFANERTFLAWVRTSLALLAAGVALQALPVDIAATPRKWLAVLFIVLALATAAVGWSRWARAERAMRRNGWTDFFHPGEEFESFLASESRRVAGVLREIGLTG